MWNLRNFNQENLFKMDRLLDYLNNNKIQYTFHTDKDRDGKVTYKIFWFV